MPLHIMLLLALVTDIWNHAQLMQPSQVSTPCQRVNSHRQRLYTGGVHANNYVRHNLDA